MRIVFVSVGQTPRADIVPYLCMHLPAGADVTEIGGLDGLSASEIEELRKGPGEPAIDSRLRDGSQITLSKPRMSDRLSWIIAHLSSAEYDLVVILSTGLFRDFESRCLTVNAQRAMEAGIEALALQGSRIGVIQPLAIQLNDPESPALANFHIRRSHAAPGDREGLFRAVDDLRDCDILVLNSVAFDELDRIAVAERSRLPVVVARRLVQSAIRLLLDAQPEREAVSDFHSKLERLTPREKQVMTLAAEGLSNKAIARQLAISPKTVEIHRGKVKAKLEVPSTAALVRLVLSADQPGLR